MRSRILILALATAASMASAQTPAATPSPATAPDISQPLNNLADQPPTHLGFVLDRSMLQAARGVLESQGMTPERAAASLSSISIDNYHYRQPAYYNQETMASILAAFRTAGWRHLVNAHEPAADGSARRVATDMWMHFTGTDIDGVTVLTRSARDTSVIQISCDLNPLDLVHLGGHFGIPKVDPNAVMVPDPKDR